MLRKTLLAVSASAMLGAAVNAPSAALAFPLGPPHLGAGGPRPPAGGLAARSGAAGRAGSGYAYSGSGSHGRHGHGSGRYGVYVDGDSGSSSDGCYYTYSRSRRVLVCD